MRHLVLLAALAAFILSLDARSDSMALELGLKEWSDRIYQVQVPKPFGDVEVHVVVQDSRIREMFVRYGMSEVEIAPTHLNDIDGRAAPEISLPNADLEGKSIEEIRLIFPTKNLSQLKGSGNEGPCSEIAWVNELKVFAIRQDGSLIVTRIDPTEVN